MRKINKLPVDILKEIPLKLISNPMDKIEMTIENYITKSLDYTWSEFGDKYPKNPHDSYGVKFYTGFFDSYPCDYTISNVDFNQMYKWLQDNAYKTLFYSWTPTLDDSEPGPESLFYINLESKIIIQASGLFKNSEGGFLCHVTVYTNVSNLSFLKDRFQRMTKIPSFEPKISFFVQREGQIITVDFPAPQVSIPDLSLNYGESFLQVHDKIVDSLNNKDTGIILLHGQPGTGKTSYLKYLLNEAPKKKKICISSDTVHILMQPDFIPSLIDHKGSILFIEDAESVVKSREHGDTNVGVANLLNLADGLLGECLKIQIICTFNTDIENIDPALRRKGRLIAEHDFKALPVEDADRLFKTLDINYHASVPMTLAEIYKFKEDNFANVDKQKTIVGFGG